VACGEQVGVVLHGFGSLNGCPTLETADAQIVSGLFVTLWTTQRFDVVFSGTDTKTNLPSEELPDLTWLCGRTDTNSQWNSGYEGIPSPNQRTRRPLAPTALSRWRRRR
jgi:hypothetical protein